MALFTVGIVFGAYSVTTGSIFGWTSGLALIAASFLLVRRWWLPRPRRR
jgi:high-affinity Fe2+/Pb2+ permease